MTAFGVAASEMLEHAYRLLGNLAPFALILMLLSIVVHRRDLRKVLLGLLPASTRINLTAYMVDGLLILVPVSMAGQWMGRLFQNNGIVLPAWHESIPVVVVGVCAVFAGDFVGYFRHRLEHSTLLWPSHVLHHSDATMNWLTVYRFHPINRLTTVVIDTCALVALGFPAWAIALNNLVRHYYGVFVHINVPWTLGPFRHILVSPAMHRWHHVRAGQGVGSNFSTVFSVFDRAFGTIYMPGPCDQPLGVEGVRDQSYVSQILLPLTASWRWVFRSVDEGREAVTPNH